MASQDTFRMFWKQRHLQIFVFAGLLFLIIFSYIPMFGIIISFRKYNLSHGLMGFFTDEWVGLKWFIEFFNDYKTGIIVRNTLVMSISKMILTYPIPIILALVLNEIKNKTFKRISQTISYLPYFISWVIVAGFCTIFFTSESGVVNHILMDLGLIKEPIPFLYAKEYWLPLVWITAIWKDMGWWAIIFLASIAGIDPTLYEAAEIDGAGRLKRIWHVTLPGIKSTLTIVTILALGNLLGGGLSGSNFEQSYLLGSPSNLEVSDIIQTYVLRVGIQQGRFSYASAMGLMQSVISLLLIYFSNLGARKVSGESLF